MIRAPFYSASRDPGKVRPHTIFASGALYPLKGFHVLLKAAGILRQEFPDLQVRTPLASFDAAASWRARAWQSIRGLGYGRYLTKLIRDADLTEHVKALPMCDAEGMVEELARAHVFCLPSFIENSSNSLAEAMLTGTPSVASFVGGIPSLVEDRSSALLVPAGDETALAEAIREMFVDDQLARRLADRAQAVAQTRHSKQRIVENLLEIYEKECSVADK